MIINNNDPITEVEINLFKSWLIENSAFNPYAIIIYDLIEANNFVENVKLIKSMRISMAKIVRLNRLCVDCWTQAYDASGGSQKTKK